ncbi:hypothetical protein [Maricaulis sp.]|uniref:hypothetical protein n=1 Tax=Maricaulis sp. TaxID=1486257 RepID=UPI002608FC1D|nr:hypothetical protein [Maricaulis sp.]
MHWLDWIWPGNRRRRRARELANRPDSLTVISSASFEPGVPPAGGYRTPRAGEAPIGQVPPPPFPPGHPRREIERLNHAGFQAALEGHEALADTADLSPEADGAEETPNRLEPVS